MYFGPLLSEGMVRELERAVTGYLVNEALNAREGALLTAVVAGKRRRFRVVFVSVEGGNPRLAVPLGWAGKAVPVGDLVEPIEEEP